MALTFVKNINISIIIEVFIVDRYSGRIERDCPIETSIEKAGLAD